MPDIIVRANMPGAPATGLTPAEKSNLITKAGGEFNGEIKVHPSVDGKLILVEKSDGTDLLAINTSTGTLELLNGLDLKMYSDNGVTQKVLVDGATGDVDVEGTVDLVSRLKGDEIWLTLPTVSGGVSPVTSGVKYDFTVPYNLQVLTWRVTADVLTTVSIELWKDTYAAYPPTSGDLITGVTGTNNPRITTAIKAESSTLTGWTTTWNAGDVVRANVVSNNNASLIGLALKVRRL